MTEERMNTQEIPDDNLEVVAGGYAPPATRNPPISGYEPKGMSPDHVCGRYAGMHGSGVRRVCKHCVHARRVSANAELYHCEFVKIIL